MAYCIDLERKSIAGAGRISQTFNKTVEIRLAANVSTPDLSELGFYLQ